MTETLDVRGLQCPLPVLKARKRMGSLAPGALLTVLATDPAARIDFPHYCDTSGHELVEQREEGETLVFVLRCVKD
ncbi:MAG: sulfurtransferase TusA family protein [Alphaproteobacteria bacterium]|nr:sulfurtransferase TusA family protein [Alphaproteobacteria bacterium]MDX5369875.1 sulfurtransferase TusA family protein [Alphaproteobacteria bacterium]MDX5464491.1 sulfurtransferase TusA family protein [Alphaproteobacteria bacterium]